MLRRLALALLALVVVPGCLTLPEPDPHRIVAGRVTGDAVTSGAYRVQLQPEDGRMFVVSFDRRDWYVAGVEREFRDRALGHATVRALDRGLLNEVAVEEVLAPAELNALRYEAMERSSVAEGRAFDRAALDAEWEARLADVVRDAGVALPAAAP